MLSRALQGIKQIGTILSTDDVEQTKLKRRVRLELFLFQSVLGIGGFGKVYCGNYLHTDEWFAVKFISKHKILELKTGTKMLYNELTALRKLESHPFISGIHYAFQDRNHCYLVLDLKRGGDLRNMLDRGFVFPEHDAAIYTLCLTSAIDYIHSKKIIHRDIKPGKHFIHYFKLN